MGDAAKGGPTLCPYLVTMNKYVGLLTLEMDLFLDFIRVRAGLTCNYHSSRAVIFSWMRAGGKEGASGLAGPSHCCHTLSSCDVCVFCVRSVCVYYCCCCYLPLTATTNQQPKQVELEWKLVSRRPRASCANDDHSSSSFSLSLSFSSSRLFLNTF
jgi:hypothetical protein